jgi:hypothetical protein
MLFSFSIAHASEKVKDDARRTLVVILVISFLPLVLGFLVAISTQGNFTNALVDVFFSGELYFYAMTLCGSIFTISQLNNHERNLDMRLWSGAFVICCGAFMALYIGQSSFSNGYDSTLHGVASVVFLLIAVLLNFRVMVLADQPPPMPEQVNRERAAEMTEAVDPEYD